MIVRNLKLDVTTEAAQRISDLGLDAEFEHVAEYTRSSIPTLTEIRVDTFADASEPAGLRIRLTAIKESSPVSRDPERRAWKDGILASVSNHFLRWFRFDLCPREAL